MFYTLMAAAALTLCGALVLDRLIAVLVRWCAPFLPRDIAGPDGWLVDTRNARGVFDPKQRS